jgi:hypothetical protein
MRIIPTFIFKSTYLHVNNICKNSHDSSVGIAMGYKVDDRGSRVWFPEGAGNFSLHHHVQNSAGAHSASCPMGSRGSSPGSKVTKVWSWHLPPSSAIKNVWSYTPTPPICLHGMVRFSKGTTLPLHYMQKRKMSILYLTPVFNFNSTCPIQKRQE